MNMGRNTWVIEPESAGKKPSINAKTPQSVQHGSDAFLFTYSLLSLALPMLFP